MSPEGEQVNADTFEERQEAHGRWSRKWYQRGERAYWCAQLFAVATGLSGLARTLVDFPMWVALALLGLSLVAFVIWRLIMRHYFRGVDRHLDECIRELQEWRAG